MSLDRRLQGCIEQLAPIASEPRPESEKVGVNFAHDFQIDELGERPVYQALCHMRENRVCSENVIGKPFIGYRATGRFAESVPGQSIARALKRCATCSGYRKGSVALCRKC